MGTLSHEQARRVYDRIGSFQDSQRFYEDRAVDLLLKKGQFNKAESVFEFGCGTGRFAINLFENYLANSARYQGCDISPEMIRLAYQKLKPHSTRAKVILSEGYPPDHEPNTFDRFVSNYVFDLLSEEDAKRVISNAHKMLRPAGKLCLVSLSKGNGLLDKIVSGAFSFAHDVAPSALGGCRPINLNRLLVDSQWETEFNTKVTAFRVTSEVLVAIKKQDEGD